MKLVLKRPGFTTSFSDSVQDESLLHFCWNGDGSIGMSFHLYDAKGQLVADSEGVKPVAPVTISAQDGEILLNIPEDTQQHIHYRLYNSDGSLLTASDGERTQVFGFLRMGKT